MKPVDNKKNKCQNPDGVQYQHNKTIPPTSG